MRMLTFTNTVNTIKTLIDIGVIWLIIYYALKIVRNNARTIQIFKGIMILFILKGISEFVGLNATSWLVDMFVNYGFITVIIIFQPEIRTLLEKLGQSNVLTRMTTLSGNELNILVNSLVDASVRLSKEQIGALITIEQGQSLSDYIKTGTRINATVSTELLCSIFVPLTPLHDGAVIIQGNNIACASAYFPPTSKDLPTKYGARHRAAIGLSEINDSITIVVSEETGTISIAAGGKLEHMDEKSLREYLLKVICVQEVEAKSKVKTKGIKFDFMNIEEPILSNRDKMNVMKSSKKTKSINPSFSKGKRKPMDSKNIDDLVATIAKDTKDDLLEMGIVEEIVNEKPKVATKEVTKEIKEEIISENVLKVSEKEIESENEVITPSKVELLFEDELVPDPSEILPMFTEANFAKKVVNRKIIADVPDKPSRKKGSKDKDNDNKKDTSKAIQTPNAELDLEDGGEDNGKE